jgi:hypothetical protein
MFNRKCPIEHFLLKYKSIKNIKIGKINKKGGLNLEDFMDKSKI